MKKITTEIKVGIFVAAVLVILAWATVRVGDKTSVHGGGYTIKTIFTNATGLKVKAPVELAGVQIGVVKGIGILNSREAEVTLALSKEVKLSKDSQAVLRTRGFLGETYVEIIPGSQDAAALESGENIENTWRSGDINSLVSQFSEIAKDVKQITESLKTTIGEGQNTPINRIVSNLEDFTRAIKDITIRNESNIDKVTLNLAQMTDQLKEIVSKGRADVEESMERIASITRKIDEGKGTVGRLVNDEETIDKLNDAVDGLNDTLGGFKRIETELGFHTEYLTETQDFKNYVSLELRPAPDKAFMFDILNDPNPNPTHTVKTTGVTVNNATTTVTTDTATIDRSKLRFSAQLAKKFYDLTLRGGVIESTAGLGLDYGKGPLGVQFSAFDFSTRYGERPHLKVMGDVNLTKNFYVLGGADDFISKQGRSEWFFGGGFRLVDDDVKTLFGAMSGKSILGK